MFAFNGVLGDEGWPGAAIRLAAGLVLLAEAVAIGWPSKRWRQELPSYILRRLGRHRHWRHVLGPTLIVLSVVFAAVGGVEVAWGIEAIP